MSFLALIAVWCKHFVNLLYASSLTTSFTHSFQPQAACSQVSAVLFYPRTAKFVLAQIYIGNMCVSRLQVKDQQHYLSQNIGPVIAGSVGPVPLALPCALFCEIMVFVDS